MLRLVGNGTTTNRDAIGARVEVTTKQEDGSSNHKLIKTLRAGEGFLSQSSKWIAIGLGTASKIEKVTVRWPGGSAETFTGVEPGGRYTLEQGSGESGPHPPRTETPRPRILKLAAGQQQRLPATDQARIRLAQPMQLPEWKWAGYGGPDRAVVTGQGRPVLIILWASWCRNCVSELKEVSKRQSELEEAGIDVVAVCTNGLGEDTTDIKPAVKLLYSIEFPFCGTRLDPQLYELLKAVQYSFIPMAGPLPLPCSFLIDGKGRVAAIYRGPVSVDDVIVDTQFPEDDPREWFEWAAALPGRSLNLPGNSDPARHAAAGHHFNLGKQLQNAGYFSTATEHYHRILEMSHETYAVYNNLGTISLIFNQIDEAIQQFRTAIEIDPDRPAAHQNLGIAYGRTNKKLLAESEFKLAVEAAPNHAEPHCLLGALYHDLSKIDESITHWQRAIELSPDRPEGYNGLGTIYLDQQQPTKAIELFETALELNPDYPEAKRGRQRAKAMLNKSS
jgi:tetratricopeptide (TPR) repeat protein